MRIRDYFVRNANGSWSPRQQVTIQGPNGAVTLSPGVSFTRGVSFNGLDIAKLCDEDATI